MSKLSIILSFVVIIVSSCNKASESSMEASSVDSVAVDMVSSSAASDNGNTGDRKFIRTADMKFRVKNVLESTYHIENVAQKMGGFVTYTQLETANSYTNTKKISADSSLETTHFSVTNTLTLRVPTPYLDTTLRQIAKKIEHLDYRTIKADDVSLEILQNSMTQKRTKLNEKRLSDAIDQRGKKLKETTTAEELLLQKQEQSDNAFIANKSLQDQVAFSTINIQIYQRETFSRQLIANEENIDEYEPGFGQKFWESIKYGWKILEEFILLLTNMWGIILFLTGGFFLFRFLRKLWKNRE